MITAKQHVQLKKGLGKTAVVIRREPLAEKKKRQGMCCLTMYSPDRSPHEYAREIESVAETLAKINRTFLVRCAGVAARELQTHVTLPRNIAIVDGEDVTQKTILFDGQRWTAGWERSREYKGSGKRELPPREATVIRLLGLLTRNADVAEVTELVKRDPALKYNLVRYLNTSQICLSAYGGFRSFEQAIMLLGYRQLSRWLSMYLLHALVEDGVPELYLTAVTRGRQMELLATMSGVPASESDLIFITGSFSLIDRMLGVTMETALGELGLDGAVSDALLEGKGPYAPFLRFATACEQGTESELYEQLAELGISASDANRAMVEGMHYAAEMSHPA